MNETLVTISGNVVNDPRVVPLGDTAGFVTFRVASSSSRVDPATGEIKTTGTSFFKVVAWRQMGLNVADSLKRGQPVLVHGKLRVNEWRTQERSGTDVEIEAYHLGHDLRFGRSAFDKVVRIAGAPFATASTPSTARPAPAVPAVPAGGEGQAGAGADGALRMGDDLAEDGAGDPLDDLAPDWGAREFEDSAEDAADQAGWPASATELGAGGVTGVVDPFVARADTDPYVVTSAVAS